MKRNPKEQLIALLEGLNLPTIIEGKSLLDHLDSSPKELKETGTIMSRLAHIGMEAANKTWEEEQKKKHRKSTKGAFGKN